MHEHWSSQYIGQPFVKDRMDCFYWFRRISLEQFGRSIAPLVVQPGRHTRCAMRLMQNPATPSQCGYVLTATPQEGDAQYLGRGGTPHHLGMIITPEGRGSPPWLLHAIEHSGVIAQPLYTLAREGWTLGGCYTHAGPDQT